MPTIVFIRHGETDWNVDGRFQGQQDIPLNDNGRAQAFRNGETLRLKMPAALSWDFVASPLIRTRQTMEIVRTACGLEPAAYRTDPILKELTFGAWEGLKADELKERWPDQVHRRELDKWGFVPPRGESYQQLSERVRAWFDSVAVDTVCVSHGGVCRVLQGFLRSLDPEETAMLDIPQDRFMVYDGRTIDWL